MLPSLQLCLEYPVNNVDVLRRKVVRTVPVNVGSDVLDQVLVVDKGSKGGDEISRGEKLLKWFAVLQENARKCSHISSDCLADFSEGRIISKVGRTEGATYPVESWNFFLPSNVQKMYIAGIRGGTERERVKIRCLQI